MTSTYPTPQPEKSNWTNARVLAVDVEVDAGAAQALLPLPLVVSDPPRATVFCADYPEGIFGIVYREAAVLIHCRDDRGPRSTARGSWSTTTRLSSRGASSSASRRRWPTSPGRRRATPSSAP
ncbi:MAG: acetoacetate decarboxylase family protein [Acidimicrobiia bacterium]|nr:acetoacetate decarboxylase family protein [Acidimicrobiia bacterium]